MKFHIVGSDGKVYGPVELDQLRRCLAEGRIESRTPVYVEGAVAWTTLGLLPEFSAAPGAQPAPIGPLPTSMPFPGTNSFATAGFVFGLLSWFCCCFPFDLLGLTFSIIALTQIRSQAIPQSGKALAIIGLVLSGAHLCFLVLTVFLQLVMGSLVHLQEVNIADSFQ